MPPTDPTPFKQAFNRLNPNQKAAVEQTDGPLLVIAGPGTGKTQLLSARVAYILQSTDTLPQNILCLTFTESGASNMRDRLTRFIGQAAFDVTIGTYHAFGGDLIKRFPQYFGDHRAQQPVDGLGQRQVVQAIVEQMSFSNPLKSTQHNLHDLLSTISEVKRGLLGEDDLRAIAADNLTFLNEANEACREIFLDFKTMPRKLDKAMPFFENLYNFMRGRDQAHYRFGATKSIEPLAEVVLRELAQAILAANQDESTKPLTAWKNQWLVKDGDNRLVFDGERENRRIAALADVFRDYTAALNLAGLYDFDDMILRSIQALETNDDLRFTLQEQYQYIMLDEFQDTNAAQLKLVNLLTDNPVHEGRPNVMAVGDDDQAIYAFQGAEVSNMKDFANSYKDTRIINLTENYRSHRHILGVAKEVATQITGRLEHEFTDLSKELTAANTSIAEQAHIDRHEFQADVGQYDWIAQRIAELIKDGVPAQEIAVLAPRHKQLEPLVPFLNNLSIPVHYEKRENILEAPVVQQLLSMSRLTLALAAGNEEQAATLWPEVLSYNFWKTPTSALWQLSWRVRDDHDLSWSQAVLDDPQFRLPGLLFLSLTKRAGTESLETMLDGLIGSLDIETGETADDMPKHVRSPLRSFYLGAEAQTEGPDLFYQTLSHLTCLRERLRDHQNAQDDPLRLPDLLALVNAYQEAGERMLNTSPYNQHAEAVQLMTVFKSKGLEFEHVFLPSLQDDVWGNSSRGASNHLKLPANLVPIRPAGTTEDERLRIFFVAITRAKLGLHLTSFTQTYSGKATKRLKYLNEQETTDGFKTMILPAEVQDVRRIDHEVPELSTLELNWRQHHLEGSRSDSCLRDLLATRLERFKLSPTHLGAFTDMIYGGPQGFFFDTILNFPRASGPDADYGTAVHETLQWIQQQYDAHGEIPPKDASLRYFEERLKRRKLMPQHFGIYLERGRRSLDAYVSERHTGFRSGNRAEYNFRGENVVIAVGDVSVPMAGKVDLMEVDTKAKTICVVDYKTGKAYDRWSSDPKLYKYRRQLLCYKLLIENSRSFRDYKVTSGRLEFVEPDDNGRIHALELHYTDDDIAETKALLAAVWQHVQALDFPDTTGYDASLSGIKQFESDLLAVDAAE